MLASRLDGYSTRAAAGAALAVVGAMEVTATPAAARPAPLMNFRRPTSTMRSQCDMAITPGLRQYAYRRAFLGRSVRLPAGALVFLETVVQASNRPVTTCRDVSTYLIIETLWLFDGP